MRTALADFLGRHRDPATAIGRTVPLERRRIAKPDNFLISTAGTANVASDGFGNRRTNLVDLSVAIIVDPIALLDTAVRGHATVFATVSQVPVDIPEPWQTGVEDARAVDASSLGVRERTLDSAAAAIELFVSEIRFATVERSTVAIRETVDAGNLLANTQHALRVAVLRETFVVTRTAIVLVEIEICFTTGKPVAIGESGQTGRRLADTVETNTATVRETARQSATTTIVQIVTEIDLAPIARIKIAILETNLTHTEDTHASVASPETVLELTPVVARATVEFIEGVLNLAPVTLTIIAIGVPDIANRHGAKAVQANRVRVLESAIIAATTAVERITRQIGFAPVLMSAVAIGATQLALSRLAQTIHANLGFAEEIAQLAALATIIDIVSQIDFTAVRGIMIAIREPDFTLAHHAPAGNTGRLGMRERTSVPASAAIHDIFGRLHFATVTGLRIAIQETEDTSVHPARAVDASRPSILVITRQSATTAIQFVDQEIALTTGDAIAVVESGPANRRLTNSILANFRAVREIANGVATAAVIQIRAQISLATVSVVTVTVRVIDLTLTHHTRAGNATRRSIRERTHIVAETAVLLIILRTHFAAITEEIIAVHEPLRAIRHPAHAVDANRAGVFEVTGIPATATIQRIHIQIGFTTVLQTSVTIRTTGIALRRPADTGHAILPGTGEIANRIAHSAMIDVRVQISLATVRRITVAVVEAGQTRAHRANAEHTARYRVREIANLTATTAILTVRENHLLTTVSPVGVAIAVIGMTKCQLAVPASADRLGMRIRTLVVALTAMISVIAHFDLTTVPIVTVTVAETKDAFFHHTTSFHTARAGILSLTDIAANATVLLIALKIGFTTIGRIMITIRESDFTLAHNTPAGNTGRLGMRERTSVPTSAAIHDIFGRLHFATVTGLRIAIQKTEDTSVHPAHAVDASRSRILVIANLTATATVGVIDQEIALTRVGMIIVAIHESGITPARNAKTSFANLRAIREVAMPPANTAIVEIHANIDFATVGRITVAVLETEFTRAQLADTELARADAIREIAHIAATTAIRLIRQSHRLATVDEIVIAIVVIRSTHGQPTIAINAERFGIVILTLFTAPTTIARIIPQVLFASIALRLIAVAKAEFTPDHDARAVDASNFRVRKRTGMTAHPTVHEIIRQIDLTAVRRIQIAIRETELTRAHHARSGDASRFGVRERAIIATLAAVVQIIGEQGLATITAPIVAIRKTGHALRRCANTVHALRTGILEFTHLPA